MTDEEIAQYMTGASALLEAMASRLPPGTVELLREYDDVGEPGLLIETVARELVSGKVPLSVDEYKLLSRLVRQTAESGHFCQDADVLLASLAVV